MGRLLARLTSPMLLHEVASPFLDVRPLACDHLSFFHDPAGLKALVDTLQLQ
jgi:hypothetical protein